jgi:nucleotide-binding universal stress UspA family protein
MNERILIAVDGSAASDQALDYVGRLFGGGSSHSFVLFTVVPPPPGSAGEGGVAGKLGPIPAAEQSHASELVTYAEREARGVLEEKAARLVAHGISADRLENVWYVSSSEGDLEHGILAEAEELDCETIVVGRHALPWYRELFHVHVADKLSQHARGRTLWIVE